MPELLPNCRYCTVASVVLTCKVALLLVLLAIPFVLCLCVSVARSVSGRRFPRASTTKRRTQSGGRMSADSDEELRVLFTAAEKGRADIINTVVEAIVAKTKPATTGASFLTLCMYEVVSCNR